MKGKMPKVSKGSMGKGGKTDMKKSMSPQDKFKAMIAAKKGKSASAKKGKK